MRKIVDGKIIDMATKEIENDTLINEAANVKIKSFEEKEKKAKEIDAIASLSDQLNLLADVCYILTEGMTEPKILEARKTLEDIREVLNK